MQRVVFLEMSEVPRSARATGSAQVLDWICAGGIGLVRRSLGNLWFSDFKCICSSCKYIWSNCKCIFVQICVLLPPGSVWCGPQIFRSFLLNMSKPGSFSCKAELFQPAWNPDSHTLPSLQSYSVHLWPWTEEARLPPFDCRLTSLMTPRSQVQVKTYTQNWPLLRHVQADFRLQLKEAIFIVVHFSALNTANVFA